MTVSTVHFAERVAFSFTDQFSNIVSFQNVWLGLEITDWLLVGVVSCQNSSAYFWPWYLTVMVDCVKNQLSDIYLSSPCVGYYKWWHPHTLMAEWLGSFTACYCGNTGVEWIPKYESVPKVDPGFSCQDLNLRPFKHESITLSLSYSCSHLLYYYLLLSSISSNWTWACGNVYYVCSRSLTLETRTLTSADTAVVLMFIM